MYTATVVTGTEELLQIQVLNKQNFRQNLSLEEKQQEGFVSWIYPIELLQKMHDLAPSVIIKDGETVAGYALVLLQEAAWFHPDLLTLQERLTSLEYNQKPLRSYKWYCMGQICIEKSYRGKGIVTMLYKKHKEIYSSKYNLLVTEISSDNPRSVKAHQKVGFEIIHTYQEHEEEWNVVVWNWK